MPKTHHQQHLTVFQFLCNLQISNTTEHEANFASSQNSEMTENNLATPFFHMTDKIREQELAKNGSQGYHCPVKKNGNRLAILRACKSATRFRKAGLNLLFYFLPKLQHSLPLGMGQGHDIFQQSAPMEFSQGAFAPNHLHVLDLHLPQPTTNKKSRH